MNNPFAQIAPAPYISKRNELPLDAILSTAGALQKRYYENKAQMDKLDIMANSLQILDNDQHIKDELLGEVDNTINAIAADEGAYENAHHIIGQLGKKVSGDPRVQAAMFNFQKKQQWDDWAAQQRAQGKFVHDFGAGDFRTVGEDGKINYWNNQQEVLLDYGDKMTDIWKNIVKGEAGVGDIDPEQLDPNNPFIRVARWQGVSPSQIDRKKAYALQQYMESDEGRQHVRYLQSTGEENPMDAIATQMEMAGDAQTYYQDQSSYLGNPEYVSSYKHKMDMLNYMAKTKGKGEGIESFTQGMAMSIAEQLHDPDHLNERIKGATNDNERNLYTHQMQEALDHTFNVNPTLQAEHSKIKADHVAEIGKNSSAIFDQFDRYLNMQAGASVLDGGKIKDFLHLNPVPVKPTTGEEKVMRGRYAVERQSQSGEYNQPPETATIMGQEYTLEERNQLFQAYKDLRNFKEDTFEDQFKRSSSELQRNSQVMIPMESSDMTDFKANVRSLDPMAFSIQQVSDGSDESLSPEDIRSFETFEGVGITPGNGDYSGRIIVKDEYGTQYALTPKSNNADSMLMNWLAKMDDGKNGAYYNQKYVGETIPQEGKEYKGIRLKPAGNGKYSADMSIEEFIGKLKEVNPNVADRLYVDMLMERGISYAQLELYLQEQEGGEQQLTDQTRQKIEDALNSDAIGAKGIMIHNIINNF